MAEPITTMNISLPESLREAVRQRMEKAGFANASEYVRHLIREDLKNTGREELERLLVDGLGSGPGRELTSDRMREVFDRAKSKASPTGSAKHKTKKAG